MLAQKEESANTQNCLEGTLVFKSSPREAGVRSLLGSCTSTSAPANIHTQSRKAHNEHSLVAGKAFMRCKWLSRAQQPPWFSQNW
jgi:hypothetical protein